MEWGNISNIWLFILVLAFAVIAVLIFKWKLNIKNNFAEPQLLSTLLPNISFAYYWVKAAFVIVALILIIIALMDPLFGSKKQTIKKEGIDIVFALDVSKSMDAEDVAPSRLTKSKKIIEETVKRLGGDRVGLIIFAGNAYNVSPLTSDYNAISTYLQTLSTELIQQQGTNTAEAIINSLQILSHANNRAKAIVLISDGENHEPNLNDALKLTNDKNTQIITLGVGTKKGAPIPIRSAGNIIDYKKDKNGNTVISKLSENNLTKIAEKTKTDYIKIEKVEETVNRLTNSILKIEKKEYGKVVTAQKNHIFQWFLLIAIILIFMDTLTSEKKLFH